MLPDPNSAQSVGWLVIAAGAAMAAMNQGHALIRRASGKEDERTISPNPLNVRAEPQYVSKEDFEAFVAETIRGRDQLHARLHGMERGLREEMKADVKDLHEKINDVSLCVARVETEQRSQGNHLQQWMQDIKDLMKRH